MQTSSRTCSSLQADLLERALEVAERARLVHAGVDEHDPVAGGQRPGVAVRHAGPRQRQAQPPDAGQHALAAPDLLVVASPRAIGLTASVRRMATTHDADAGAVAREYFDAIRRGDPQRPARAAYADDAAIDDPRACSRTRARGRADRVLRGAVGRVPGLPRSRSLDIIARGRHGRGALAR